jgi:hypothetical protein
VGLRPRSANSAHFFFVNDKTQRAIFYGLYPDHNYRKLTEKMKKAWQKMSNYDKQPFEALAAEDLERFKLEKAFYDEKNKAKLI